MRVTAKCITIGKFCQIPIVVAMAVPKKKTSNSKRDHRRAHWRQQAALQAQKALSLGKSILTGRSTSFVYPESEEDEDEE
jgi:large subunit ribosomal protein L32